MLQFDPAARISVPDALAHPWLSSYHETSDEPTCPTVFTKWEDYEKLETLDELREALWEEVEDYRREVRGLVLSDISGERIRSVSGGMRARKPHVRYTGEERDGGPLEAPEPIDEEKEEAKEEVGPMPPVVDPGGKAKSRSPVKARQERDESVGSSAAIAEPAAPAPTDPLVSYARRSTLAPQRRGSFVTAAQASSTISGLPTIVDHPLVETPMPAASDTVSGLPSDSTGSYFPFPTTKETSYVIPARNRTASFLEPGVAMGARRLLRTLSTISVHESLPGGLPAEMQQFIAAPRAEITGAEAPASELPPELREEDEDEEGSSAKNIDTHEEPPSTTTSSKDKKKFSV